MDSAPKSLLATAAIAGIVNAFVGGLIDKGFDMMGNALNQAAGKEAKHSATVSTGARLYQGATSAAEVGNGLLAVAHGTFGAGDSASAARTPAEEKTRAAPGLLPDKTGLLVCRMEYAESGNAMCLQPLYLRYDGDLGGDTKANLVVHVTFRVPGKPSQDAESTAFGATTLTFTGMRPRTELGNEALKSRRTEWVSPSERKGEGEIRRFPVVADIQAVETAKPSKRLQLMAGAFAASNADWKKAMTATINVNTK